MLVRVAPALRMRSTSLRISNTAERISMNARSIDCDGRRRAWRDGNIEATVR